MAHQYMPKIFHDPHKKQASFHIWLALSVVFLKVFGTSLAYSFF